MRKKIITTLFIAFLLVAVTGSTKVLAGGGTYTDGTPDALTLNVLFEFDIGSNFNPSTTWEGVLNRTSELLYNSTDGQVQIGTVNFYNNCPEMADKADIIVQSGSGGASAHVGGMGTNGLHVFIYNDTHSQNTASARGQFGLVHELGHYVFGLYDSYKNSAGNPSSCINSTSTVASIMDGGTTVQPNNQRTEWALPADEATCKDTVQYEKRKMVDWPWIVQYASSQYGVALTQPAAYNTSAPAGHKALTFNYFNCKLRAVVCADVSGSMADENKLDVAKQGAKLFADLTKNSDDLGVSTFSDGATINYPITPMSAANKGTVKSTIDTLQSMSSTNIGGGLQTSLDMIMGQGSPVSNEVVVLLSDGRHNTGTSPDMVVPELKARGVVVYAIGLGSDADAGLLSSVANQTGGVYFFAADASSLTADFNSIFTQVRNDGAVTKLNEDINAGETDSHSIDIDKYTEAGGEATFVLTWQTGDLSLSLVRPDGSTVAPNNADVSYAVQGATSSLYRMSNPRSGKWTVNIRSGSAATNYTLQVNSTSKSNVSVVTFTDKGLYYSGEPVIVSTSVLAPPSGAAGGKPVSGAEVTGVVKQDGAQVGTIILYDDGKPSHGDKQPNDGVYSNVYNPASSGNFAFEVTVNNSHGTTSPPDEEYPNWTPQPVDPFKRVSETTVVVDLSVTPPQPPTVIPPDVNPPAPAPTIPGGGGGGLGIALVLLVLVAGGVFVVVSSRRRGGTRTAFTGPVSPASIYFQSGPLAGQRVMIGNGMTIGRGQQCGVRINDPSVSRVHAQFKFAQGNWFIQDQKSSGGTFVNGQRISATRLNAGSQIQIGKTLAVFDQQGSQ